jgi:hypothetical protein
MVAKSSRVRADSPNENVDREERVTEKAYPCKKGARGRQRVIMEIMVVEGEGATQEAQRIKRDKKDTEMKTTLLRRGAARFR